MRDEYERERKIAALDAELARHARMDRLTVAILVAVVAVVSAVLLAPLVGTDPFSGSCLSTRSFGPLQWRSWRYTGDAPARIQGQFQGQTELATPSSARRSGWQIDAC